MVRETLVYSALTHLTRLISRQIYTENNPEVNKHMQSTSQYFSVYLTNRELLSGSVDWLEPHSEVTVGFTAEETGFESRQG
jgi:hypothetical protein